jgi:hydroxymethylbilane synthase
LNIRIATRKSALAMWQAEHVAARLRALDAVEAVELVPLSTRGDEVLDRSLQKIGGKGLFIKELEVAMRSGAADIAVHSMKDVPADMPDGFTIGAVLERANHADALVSPAGRTLADLAKGALIGSSSLRRQAQLKMLRPDLRVEPLRGNVNTRLDKLDRGEFDAIVLAAAGLERLGLADRISHAFEPGEMMPAAAQGVIGIECREDDSDTLALLQALDHEPTARTTSAERAIAIVLAASCQSPVASFATIDGTGEVNVTALVALPDGSESIRESLTGNAGQAGDVGRQLADVLVSRGAKDLLARCEAMHD